MTAVFLPQRINFTAPRFLRCVNDNPRPLILSTHLRGETVAASADVGAATSFALNLHDNPSSHGAQ